jgi:hypothetical protein
MQVLLNGLAAAVDARGPGSESSAESRQTPGGEADGMPTQCDAAAPEGALADEAVSAQNAGTAGNTLKGFSIEWDFSHHAYYPVLRCRTAGMKKSG